MRWATTTAAALATAVAGILSSATMARAEDFIEPLPFHPPLSQRTNLLRTLTLLQTSTAEAPNTVRVLFYGQSITEQGWWRRLVDHLHATYPTARLEVENRAIGGHAAQRLVRTAEADLYPFQPDLLVFHVYGAHGPYEDILRRVRERTTADILLQTDHVTRPAMLGEETLPARLTPTDWDAWMNYSFLPSVAARYGACRADVRDRWKRHLRDTQLEPADFLRDEVHLNPHGEFLMAEILRAYLAPLPEDLVARCRPFDGDRVQTRQWTPVDGRVQATFEGARLDVRPVPGQSWAVRVDGKPPLELPGAVGFGRVSAFPGSGWPMILRVDASAPLVPETWTLVVDAVSPDGRKVDFHLRGSVTGEDGAGVSTQAFVSRSRRVVLQPEDWNVAYCQEVFHRALSPGATITWTAEPRGLETVRGTSPAGVAEPGWVTVVQGLSNGPHTVTLEGVSSGPALARVYRPPLRASVASPASPP